MNTINWLMPENLIMNKIRNWLENFQITEAKKARLICQLIPSQCPFEREIYLFSRKVAYIPPLCKLNPFYEEFVTLRFRALCYLADDCGEDISEFLV